ncbi:MAG: hypothetical protein N4J56_000842 [Chroococcidiopsis sp. SAG 2025]|uniref:tyrosinase family protein n=1 Tax=Chroococcidiopsis sp. SAG 2025 TaxID=171389 RepID=UPI002936D889|nr:tyrosinase family protein [Chroococcidiopsis sp. SAG 2025]MDV2991188.1 hypothetical protein [Chroococcidiopsis sp. SAG 2025]
MSYELSRRQVLKLAGFLSAGTAAVGSVPIVSRFFADRANAQTGTIYIRENIYTFIQSPQKVAALRRGIQVMKSRPDTNPTSWIYQANMHGIPSGETRRLTAWRTCQHGTFYFFPWHRMYLYYFERILRQASGDPTLALPYWNYSDSVEQRVLPEPFRIPADSTNPLYSDRGSSINVNQGDPLPEADVRYADAFQRTNFFHTSDGGRSFGGRRVTEANANTHRANGYGDLERRPHNGIHSRIGGLMGSVPTAARDPIFWLHHANIDRLWERWLRLGGGRANATTNSDWMNDTFIFFDENGTQVQLRGRDVLDTAGQLNYLYDDPLSRRNRSVAPSSQSTDTSTQQTDTSTQQQIAMSANDRQLTIVLSDTPLTLSAPAQDLVRTRALTAESALTLNITGVEYNPDNPIPYDIYINLPEGVAPDPYGPYYAGILSLFSLPQKGTFRLDITSTVRQLQRRSLMTGDFISVTFVPPYRQIQQERSTQDRQAQLQGAVRFSGVTLTRE